MDTVFINTELLTLLFIAALLTELTEGVMAVLIKDLLFLFSVAEEIIFSPHC